MSQPYPEPYGDYSGKILAGNLTLKKWQAIQTDSFYTTSQWRTGARCIELVQQYPDQYRANDWFPPPQKGGVRGTSYHIPAHVKAACDECPVRLYCLVYAIQTDQPDGVWAGRAPTSRRKIRRKLFAALRKEKDND